MTPRAIEPSGPSAPEHPSTRSVAPAPLIEVRNLVKKFDDKVVLDGISFTLHRGETLVVIGGSGCGKTTLARVIIGLERPKSGQILIEGEDIGALDDDSLDHFRHRFAMVFQRSALLDSMNVFDNVAFPLREETRLGEAEIRERVMFQLRELGVEQATKKLPSELSGGMAKRVGIARAMVTEPEILVYDEPTSGLDPISSRVVDKLIERMREKFFVTSIVITHDMVTAYEIADRVLLLAHGKVAANGPPETIFRSHSEEIRPFALSSGIDIERLAPRSSRRPAREISARWMAAHPKSVEARRPWYARWRHDG